MPTPCSLDYVASLLKRNFLHLATCILWFHVLKGLSRSNVDALSELYFPFLKGGDSVFIPAVASGLFLRNSNNYAVNDPNGTKMGSNY